MPNVLVRDLDTAVLEKLKARASDNSRSLQAEVHFILSFSVKNDPLSDLAVAEKIKKSLRKGKHSDSAALLREDRDR